MSAPSLSADQVRQQLEKILSSAGFARNERMGRFLRFVVEQQLDEGHGRLKETVIGVEVFGRKPDYDPKLDSIVKTEAGRLRTRLAEYYAKEGAADPIVIDLPKGGYAPLIQPRGLAPLSRRQSAILNLEPSTRNLQSAFGRPWGKAAFVAGAFVLLATAWLAEKAFRRAIELNPNLTAAYVHLAYAVLCPTGRFEEVLQELDKTFRADPLSADPWEPRASALLYAGRAAEAIAILEQSGEASKAQLGYAYAITGRRAEAEALVAEAANVPRRRAWIYAGLGDKDRVYWRRWPPGRTREPNSTSSSFQNWL